MITSFILSLGFCYILVYFSKKNKWIEVPRADRWNQNQTPKYGGVAIFISFTTTVFLYLDLDVYISSFVILSSIIFFVGLIDDIYNIKPVTKMLGIILLSIFCFFISFRFFPSGPIYFSLPLTILWYAGVINAVNIIDNMDGLSAGTSIISLFLLMFFSFQLQQGEIYQLVGILAGSCIGFLFFNFHPAKLFMGDSGSLFIGFLLATFSLEVASSDGKNIIFTLLFPVLIMAYPIFDTFLVTINRVRNNIPIYKGGRDHSSHRLVMIGLSEKKAVFFLYLISISFGLIAIQFNKIHIRLFASILILFTLALIGLGIFISNYRIKDNSKIKETDENTFINSIYLYKKQILELFFDSLLITCSFTLSHYLRFEESSNPAIWKLHDSLLPLVISLKLLIFYYFKLYRGFWKYASVTDLLNVLKATFSSTLVLIFFLFFFKVEYFSRSVFIIDFILCFTFISSFRFFYKIIISFIKQNNIKKQEEVLLIGSGDLLEICVRYLILNDRKKNNLVGILSRESDFWGRNIHSIPILGGLDDFKKVIELKSISKVISTINSKNNEPTINNIKKYCSEKSISFSTVNINIE